MPLTQKHRDRIIATYCILFYVLMLHKIWNGFLLSQLQPFLFITRFDMFTWLVMNTGLHQLLLNNRVGYIVFDAVFYAMPLLYWFAYKRTQRLASVIAVVMLVVNWLYLSCYTLFPGNSIEGFTPWLLFPFLLMRMNLQRFYFVLHALRYFFLYFFASAAVWKFVQGGIFSKEQMSGVLLYQHKDFLATSPTYWYTSLIYWLVSHSLISYFFYMAATILELLFIIGFFTKKYDRYLVAAFLLFLIFDVLIMRIPYWEITPFMITLVYSKFAMPPKNDLL